MKYSTIIEKGMAVKGCNGSAGVREITRRINDIYLQFHRPEYIGMDPLITVRSFDCRADREVGGFIAAALSYGRVEIIIRSIGVLFNRMGSAPSEFAVQTSFAEKRRAFRGFRHRFNDGDDMARLLQVLADLSAEYGTLEESFALKFRVTDGTVRGALAGFVEEVRRRAARLPGTSGRGFDFLAPSPASGCACKRPLMFLRWMVRPDDGIDMGVWNSVPASALVIPVDTHIAAIAHTLGMTHRTTADWRMAEEITARLRGIDPFDPVRFDFSLCRSGMVRLRRDAA